MTSSEHRMSRIVDFDMPSFYYNSLLRRSRGDVKDSGEIGFWKWIDHENILALYEKFEDAHSVYFVTDPVVRGHVGDWLHKRNIGAAKDREKFFRNVTRQVVSALAEMHEIGLAHCDFNWSKVWLNEENNAFLGGFAKTRSIRPPGDARVGQLTYDNTFLLAPEIIRSIADDTNLDLAQLPKADIWAVGVALFDALAKEWDGGILGGIRIPPNPKCNIVQALINDGGLERVRSYLLRQGISAAATAFIIELLEPDPSERPSASQCLQQPWLMEMKTSDVMTNLPKMGPCPDDAEAVEEMMEALPKQYRPLGEKLERNGYDIQEVLFEDAPHGTVVATAKCGFDDSFVSVKAVQESLCEKGEKIYWKQLRHERCMQLLDTFADHGFVFFVTDHMKLGSVEHHAKKEHVYDWPPLQREEFYRPIVTYMVEGLHYLHQQGLVHLDLHWRNVFLHETDGAKLCGFKHLTSLKDELRGLKYVTSLRPMISMGYMPFRAPESFIPAALDGVTLQKADIWSLGAAMLDSVAQLNIGGYHFQDRQIGPSRIQCTFANIEDNLPRLAEALSRGHHSHWFQDLVIRLMHFQPQSRPTAAQILHHPWLRATPGTDVV